MAFCLCPEHGVKGSSASFVYLMMFLIFVFSTVSSKYLHVLNKMLPMTGFELQTSGLISDRPANWVTNIDATFI